MHWLAIVFLVLKALNDVCNNADALNKHKYSSLLGCLLGSFANIFAWVYVLNYVIHN